MAIKYENNFMNNPNFFRQKAMQGTDFNLLFQNDNYGVSQTDLPRIQDVNSAFGQGVSDITGVPEGLNLPRINDIPNQNMELPRIGEANMSYKQVPDLIGGLTFPLTGFEKEDQLAGYDPQFSDFNKQFAQDIASITGVPEGVSLENKGVGVANSAETNVSKQQIMKKKNNNALDETDGLGDTDLTAEKKSIWDDANSLNLAGAALKDLGSLFGGKDTNYLQGVKDRITKDQQFAIELMQREQANQMKLNSARLASIAKMSQGDEKARVEAAYRGTEMSRKFQSTDDFKRFSTSQSYAKMAQAVLNNKDLKPSQVADALLFYTVKMREPTSAVLENEFRQGAEALGSLKKMRAAGGLQVPRGAANVLDRYLDGSTMNEDDIKQLAEVIETMFSQQDNIYQERRTSFENQIGSYNKNVGTFNQIPQGTYGNRIDTTDIYEGFKTGKSRFDTSKKKKQLPAQQGYDPVYESKYLRG